jgi:hypothetical protein
MSFAWWTILDTHGKLLNVKSPSSVAVLDTLKLVCLATITIPRSKALKSFVLLIQTYEWHTHTIPVSVVSRLPFFHFLPVFSPSSTLI